MIDYVRVFADLFGGTVEYENGTYTIFENMRMNRESVFYFWKDHPLAGDTSVMRGIESAENYQIQECKYDPVDSTFNDQGHILADFWYHWRGDIERCKVKKFFGVRGLDYDFLKDFTEGGENFTIFEMIKDLDNGTTDIHAFNLGAS